MRISDPHFGRAFQTKELLDKLLFQNLECTPDETFVYHLALIRGDLI